MQTSPTRLALAAAAGLVPGILGGFLLTPDAAEVAALRRIERDSLNAAGAANSSVAEAARTAGAEGRGAEGRGAAGHGARPSTGNATPNTAAGVPTGAGSVPAASDATPAGSALRDELLALIASGRLEAKLAENPDALLDLLVRLEVQLGQPAQALALLEGQANVSLGTWEQLYSLCAATHPDIASIAMRRAFHQHLATLDAGGLPATFEHPASHHLECLLNVDPSAALEMLALLRARSLVSTPELLTFEARALARNGQTDRARDVLLALMEDPEQYWTGLSTLVALDPTTAEQMLRENVGHAEWGNYANQQLLTLLTGQGRRLEAMELFESALAGGKADSGLWWQMIQSLDAATLDAELDRWLALGPVDMDVQQTLANHFANIGATKRSLECFADLWEQSLAGGGWLPQIPIGVVKAHPADALALLDSAASKLPENDEMWGDVADMYWMAGENDLAVAAWKHAQQLDPNDGEWTNKLDQAANGGSPIWTGEESSALGDTSDLWPQPGPLSLFDQPGSGGLGYWGESNIPPGGSFLGDSVQFDASGIYGLGYVEISDH
jgi:tetratricopeptide (TPR) repeat protein